MMTLRRALVAVSALAALAPSQAFVAPQRAVRRCESRVGAGFGAPVNKAPKKKKKSRLESEAPKAPKARPEMCPCHSGLPYATCCEPCHADHRVVASPEMLLRSRYAAFSLQLPEYLVDTTHRDHKDHDDDRPRWVAKVSKGLDATRFTALRVKAQRSLGDDEHEITFEADLQPVQQRGYGAKAVTLFERSIFRRGDDGTWLYAEGLDVNAETTKAAGPSR